MQMKGFRRQRQQECKTVTPKRPDEIVGGGPGFSATSVNLNQSITELLAFLKSQQIYLSQRPQSMTAGSGTQILPGWSLNRPAAYILQEPCSGTNDSFTLLSPVSGSKFMVAWTLINVHSQRLSVWQFIVSHNSMLLEKMDLFFSSEKLSVRKTSISFEFLLSQPLFL